MESSKIRVAAELAGIIAVLSTLVLILMQLKQAEIIASAEFSVSLVTAGIETSNLISDNATTWVKGCSGEQLDAPERAIFERIVADLDTRWFVEHRHAMRLGETEQADAILHDWAAYLHRRPGLREAWLSRTQRLTADRNLLSEGGVRFNYWSDAIEADFTKLESLSD